MNIALVRYGAVPEVARCGVPESLPVHRDDEVVVRTHRGLEGGRVLEFAKPVQEPGQTVREPSFQIERLKTDTDRQLEMKFRERVQEEFDTWNDRIVEWDLDLQLIEMDWTIDGEKLVLYVLNERGPECTKLALQAAAAGLGVIEVQPVSSEGPVAMPSTGGGCGSGGCGSGGCH